jgi:hypothetical protein
LPVDNSTEEKPQFIPPDILKLRGVCKVFAAFANEVYTTGCRDAPARYRVLKLAPRLLSLEQLHAVLCGTIGAAESSHYFGSVIDTWEVPMYIMAVDEAIVAYIRDIAGLRRQLGPTYAGTTVSEVVTIHFEICRRQLDFFSELCSAAGEIYIGNILGLTPALRLLRIDNDRFWNDHVARIHYKFSNIKASDYNILPKLLTILEATKVPHIHIHAQEAYMKKFSTAVLSTSFIQSTFAQSITKFELGIQQDLDEAFSLYERPTWHVSPSMLPHKKLAKLISCMPNIQILAIALSEAERDNRDWLALLALPEGFPGPPHWPHLNTLSLSRFRTINETVLPFFSAHTSTLKSIRLDGCGCVSMIDTYYLLKTLRDVLALERVYIGAFRLPAPCSLNGAGALERLFFSYCGWYANRTDHLVDFVRRKWPGQCRLSREEHEAEDFKDEFLAI